jgi:hypothetical protein
MRFAARTTSCIDRERAAALARSIARPLGRKTYAQRGISSPLSEGFSILEKSFT